VVVPPWDFGPDLHGIAWTARIAVSVIYGIDLALRSVVSGRPVRYALTHPVVLASVAYRPAEHRVWCHRCHLPTRRRAA
jgi:hypothetical protein